MAKYVTLGNGELLVGFDRYGRVQDLHFPYVGRENHVALSHIHHIGVWSEGTFFWFDHSSWEIAVECNADNFVGTITALNNTLRVKLVFTDVVYNEKNILLREVQVYNLDENSREREIKVFFGQQFQISESKRGDTAYFDPRWQHACLGLAQARARAGHVVICVLHDLNLASQYADRLHLMDAGQLRVSGSPEAVLNSPWLDRAYGMDFVRVADPEHPAGVMLRGRPDFAFAQAAHQNGAQF